MGRKREREREKERDKEREREGPVRAQLERHALGQVVDPRLRQRVAAQYDTVVSSE